MIMAIIGGSAEGGVEIDINQADQNTFIKNYQKSSCCVFWFDGSSPGPLFPKHFFMDRGVKSDHGECSGRTCTLSVSVHIC